MEFKQPLSTWESSKRLLITRSVYIQHQDKVLPAQPASRPVCQRIHCPLLFFSPLLFSSGPSLPHWCEGKARCACTSHGAGLCTPSSLFSLATLHTTGKLPDFNLGSCNIHLVATSFIVSGLGVPQSKGEGGRINDCSHELFSTPAIPEEGKMLGS